MRDYSLLGNDGKLAVERGLSQVEWYLSPVPRKRMKELMRRRNGPAIRDTHPVVRAADLHGRDGGHPVSLVVVGPVLPRLRRAVRSASGFALARVRPRHGVQDPLDEHARLPHRLVHGACASRPCGVGATPATTPTRSSSAATPRSSPAPAGLWAHRPQLLRSHRRADGAAGDVPSTPAGRLHGRGGDLHPGERAAEGLLRGAGLVADLRRRDALALRRHAEHAAADAGRAAAFYGAWHHLFTGLTQHVGLAEDVLDHRLNSRTVYMNPVQRFLYWNMNYHVEHHMFPMVPYHALPALHAEMQDELPHVYPSVVVGLPRDHPDAVAAAEGPGLLHPPRAAAGHGRARGRAAQQAA